MPSTRKSRAQARANLKGENKPEMEKTVKPRGSAPKVRGKKKNSNWKTERISQLLRLGKNDNYPPSTEAINPATRIIDLETALKNAKTKDHDKIEKKIKESFLKLNAVLGKRREVQPIHTGEDNDPISLTRTVTPWKKTIIPQIRKIKESATRCSPSTVKKNPKTETTCP